MCDTRADMDPHATAFQLPNDYPFHDDLRSPRPFVRLQSGGGGEGGQGGGGEGGRGGGDRGGSGAIRGGGRGSADAGTTPIRLSDDALIQIEGSDKPVTWRDYRAGFVPRDEYDRWNTTRTRATDILIAEARRLDQEAQKIAAATKGDASRRESRPDPLADIRKLPLVDGETLSQLYQRIQTEGIGPIAQVLGKYQQVIGGLLKRIENVEQGVERYSTAETESSFRSKVEDILESAGFDPDDETLHEIARDIFQSWEWDDEDKEFPEMLLKRLESSKKYWQTSAKREAELKKEEIRKFPSRRGTATPGKSAQFKFENGSTIAARMKDAGMFD